MLLVLLAHLPHHGEFVFNSVIIETVPFFEVYRSPSSSGMKKTWKMECVMAQSYTSDIISYTVIRVIRCTGITCN